MLAATLRLVTVAVLCGLIVRDILHPEQDAVRQTYADDPDGGVLDGAPDAPWLTRWRKSMGVTKEPAAEPVSTPPDGSELASSAPSDTGPAKR